MNRHGLRTEIKKITFFSFKGDAKVSTMDQITLPPSLGLDGSVGGLFHRFGEWLKREGVDWQYASEEELCILGIAYWNASLTPNDLPRRFDRMVAKKEQT